MIFVGGAPGRDRTSTPVKATDFESAASTNSATGALPLGGENGSELQDRPRFRQQARSKVGSAGVERTVQLAFFSIWLASRNSVSRS